VFGSGVIQPWALEHLPTPTNHISLIPNSHRTPAPSAETN